MKDSVGMIGIRADATGRAMELPVRSNYKYGLNPLEYFTATRGTRKSLIDIALRTADSGYLTRRLVDVAQDVFTIDSDAADPGFPVYRSDSEAIGTSLGDRLTGRYVAENVKKHIKAGELVTPEIAEAIQNDESVDKVNIMSVLSCTNSRGVSQKSYGIDLATGELVAADYPIGVIAAQSIGEPGTQLSLDSKHRAGAVTAGDDVTQGLTRVEELLEVRTPEGLDALLRLLDDADVFLQNMNPAKLVRMGIDGESLRARNPRLVYCAMSGFGLDGPDSALAGYDLVAIGNQHLLETRNLVTEHGL
jgi:DNA-directed RNA polymerase subunit beta'